MKIGEVQLKSTEKNLVRRNGKKKVTIVCILFICILAGISVLGRVVKQKQYKNSIEAGEQYLKEQQYEDAIHSFEKAIKYGDEEVEPYWNEAKIYVEMGEKDQAGQAYDRVIEVLINKITYEKKTTTETEEICKEEMAFWWNVDTMQKEEKLDKIESILSKIDPYIDESIREELHLEKIIYEHNGIADDRVEGTYISETKKSYGRASAGTTQYTIDELYKPGVVFYEKGDFNSDGKKEMVIVYSNINEKGNLVLTASFYTYNQKKYQDYEYSLTDLKNAYFHFFVYNNYFVVVEQEDKLSGFYSGIYYPVLNEMEEYQKSIDNHFDEKICVIDLEGFKTQCEFERVIYDSSTDNHISTSTLNTDEEKNKSAFSKGYASYKWSSDTEVVLNEEKMNDKVLARLSSYGIDNISLQKITWEDRKNGLKVEENSNLDNIKKISLTSSNGDLDDSDPNDVKVTGSFIMGVESVK